MELDDIESSAQHRGLNKKGSEPGVPAAQGSDSHTKQEKGNDASLPDTLTLSGFRLNTISYAVDFLLCKNDFDEREFTDGHSGRWPNGLKLYR